MRVNELFLETKKKKKEEEEKKMGINLLDSRGVSFRVVLGKKKKRGNKIVRFEEKENELKRRKEKAGS